MKSNLNYPPFLRRCAAVICVCLGLCQAAWAETATVNVFYLPLQEAADLAKSQLSSDGRVAQLPSRRVLVIQDDAKHVRQAKAILKQLDVPVSQLSVQVDMDERESDSGAQLTGSTALSGGWVRLKTKSRWEAADDSGSVRFQAGSTSQQDWHTHHFSLRLASGKRGHIEAGEIRVARPEVRETLVHYGMEDSTDLALIPITAGFDVRATLIDDTHARLHIRPWFSHTEQKTDVEAKTEILLDLGSTSAPQQPPGTSAPMRANITPAVPKKTQYVRVADAETDLVVELDKPVILAAATDAARTFSQALLSTRFNTSDYMFRMRIQVNKAR